MTISGFVNSAALANGSITTKAGTAAAVEEKTSKTSLLNVWSTSQVSIAGNEDLGGGLKASFTINSGIGGASATSDTFGSRDTFLALAGGFGKVQLGKFISASTMGYHGYSGAAAASGAGSIYHIGAASSSAERFGAAGTAGTAVTTKALSGGSFERNSNQVQYTSPSFSGVTVNVDYGVVSTNTDATMSKASTTTQGASVAYKNGPLSLGMGTNKRDYIAEGTASAVGAEVNAKLDWVGASYQLGTVTLTGTQVSRKDSSVAANAGATTTNSDIKATSFGASMPMGKYTFAASMYTGKNKGTALATDDQKLKGHQLTVRYAFSKRTTAFALNGVNDLTNDSGNTAGTARKEKMTMVGLMHAF